MNSLRHSARSLFLGSFLLSLARSATAGEETELASESIPRSEKVNWYGPALLAADAGAITTLVVGVTFLRQSQSDPLDTRNYGLGLLCIGLGASAYLAPGPIAHAAHGKGWAAVGSLSLRLGAPLVASGAFTLAGASVPVRAVAYFGGAVGAALIDDLVLARETKVEEKGVSVSLVPVVDPVRGVGALSLSGSF